MTEAPVRAVAPARSKSTPSPGEPQTYTAVAILLHWLIAAAIVVQLVLAWRMQGPRTPETFAVFQLHKSVGITILLASLLRLGWRLAHPPPPLPDSLTSWERRLARVTHVALYVLMIGLPLTGWLTVSASRLAIPTRLFGLVPWPDLPGLACASAPVKAAWYGAGLAAHQVLALTLGALLALHVAGALKHQLFAADEPVLGRMAPGACPGRRADPRLAVVAVGALAAATFAWFTPAPGSRIAPPPRNAPAAGPERVPQVAAAAPLATPRPTPEPAAKAEPRAAAPMPEPVRWTIAKGSSLTFSTAWGGQPIQGRFGRWTADVLFSPDALDRSQVTVTVDVDSANTGDDQRDASLIGGDWLDADSHPKAVFTARRFERTGPESYLARGTLELRGLRRPVVLRFRLHTDGETARVSGRTTLTRGDFGVGQGEFEATDQVPAAVGVHVDLTAHRTDRP